MSSKEYAFAYQSDDKPILVEVMMVSKGGTNDVVVTGH
jgi:hypothetical protein